VKNSFTLFETILALTVISILIGGFLRTSNYSASINFHSIKNTLLLEQSSTLTSDYFGVNYSHDSKLIVKLIEEGTYKKLIYSKDKIFLEKFILPESEINLSSKVFP